LKLQFDFDREGQVVACLGKFSEVPQILYQLGITLGSVDGILFDVGASSMQYDQRGRGFSVSHDDPLDMRMDQGRYVRYHQELGLSIPRVPISVDAMRY
jgi:16S rRNA C1402 N4-methylase RsmH